jgi:hypothetical protein
MIKFFRQIRYQLMGEHKTGKYLKYAIGEIVLVIIGILIAVSINDWNTDRKIRIEEQEMLKDLRKEVEGNLRLLNEVNAQHERSFKAAGQIRDMYMDRSKFEVMTDSSFFELHERLNRNRAYEPNYGILNSIISSGQIGQISNKELTYVLASLKERAIEAFHDQRTINREKNELLKSAWESGIEVRDGKIHPEIYYKAWFDHPKFRLASSWLFYLTRQYGLKKQYAFKEYLEQLLDMIDQEIMKNE